MRGPRTVVVLILLLLTCCSAYLRLDAELNHSATTVSYQQGRRFGWVINWLNERGPVGQVFANLVIALFVLPPLGPIVCSFLENCDSTRATARRLVHTLVRGRSLTEGALSDEAEVVLRWIDNAYNEYS